jgi:hypothetical protein
MTEMTITITDEKTGRTVTKSVLLPEREAPAETERAVGNTAAKVYRAFHTMQ